MADDRVSISITDGIADVRMTRADKRNALDGAMFLALAEAGGEHRAELVLLHAVEVGAVAIAREHDARLVVLDAYGKQVALNDDHEDKGAGLDTHHADSRLTARLPANGIYLSLIHI